MFWKKSSSLEDSITRLRGEVAFAGVERRASTPAKILCQFLSQKKKNRKEIRNFFGRTMCAVSTLLHNCGVYACMCVRACVRVCVCVCVCV